MHVANEALSQIADFFALFYRPLDDLVINVGDVANIGDLIATGPQPALYSIEHNQHAGMADVAVVVDRHAADIHAHLARLDGLERFLGA